VAAFAAMGATSLLPTLARAQDGSGSSDGDTTDDNSQGNQVACSASSTDGTYDNPANNYQVTSKSAAFAFIGGIKAVGDGVTLFADDNHGGVKTENLALVKGNLARQSAEDPLTVSSIGFEAPLTALAQNGEYYGVVQLSHDQKVPVGVVFFDGDTQLGGWELTPDEFDPTSRDITFGGEAASQIYQWLRTSTDFKMDLAAGDTVYSVVTADSAQFVDFIDNTLTGQMNQMALQDSFSPCYDQSQPDYFSDGTGYGCFLTTACCAVVGLPDDCWELETLRRFRDGWMSRFAEGRADVERYYREAPAVAGRLSASRAGRSQLLRLYWTVIVPSAVLIRLGANRLAYRLYRRMMLDLLP
jgi:hypothetical protein